MSNIQKALDDAGVTLNHYNKPDGNPTKDAFARVISAVRKAESDSLGRENEALSQAKSASDANVLLVEEIQKLKAQVAKFALKDRMDAIDGLLDDDKQNLLELMPA